MTGSAQLHHVVRGTGAPVVMIHGFTVDHRIMLPLEAVFDARRGWRRIYVDLPGFGATPRLPHPMTADAVAEAVMGFVGDHVGSEPFAIVGGSFGGQIARHVVAELGTQVLGMCLLAPLVAPAGQRRLPADGVVVSDPEFMASLSPADRAAFAEVAVAETEASWRLFRDHVLPGLLAHDRGAAEELWASYMVSTVPETRSSPFPGPCLTVTGRQDRSVGFHDQLALLEHYPHMTYAVLDGAGHNVHLDQPTSSHALVDAWLVAMETAGRGGPAPPPGRRRAGAGEAPR